MAESFYGGRPGVSFIIVANYGSEQEMIQNFQRGADYEAVHFDEHVLINTSNKNDPTNGNIYRRGYDYTNDMGGAIYVGTIVGPAGIAPFVELTTYDEVVAKKNEEGYEYRYSEGEYAPYDNLVPGKSGDEYQDSIKWACYSYRDENGEETICYVGFIFPYLVVDYEADSVSPYYNRDSDNEGFTNINLIDRTDSGDHPFWEQWHISVPKGIKGDTFENFRVVTANDNDNVESYTGQEDDRTNNRKILVYDYYHYDKEEGGEPVSIYLGDYNMIVGIVIDEDGTITIEYSHEDKVEYQNLFKWIKEVELDTTNGHFTIVYNYDTDENGNSTRYETDLAWVSAITLAEDGKVTIHHITGKTEELDESIQWIDSITLDENGTIEVNYNTGNSVSWDNILRWITDVSLTEDGTFTISFNDGTDNYTTSLTWVDDISFDENGTVTISYNNGNEITYDNLIQWITNISLSENGHLKIDFNNNTDSYETDLVWVASMTFDEEGTVTISYNDGNETIYNNLVQWITNVSLSEDGHFKIDFNNGIGSYEADLTWVQEVNFAEDGIVTIVLNNGETIEYPNIKWITSLSLSDNGTFNVEFNTGDKYETNLIWVTDLSIDEEGIVKVGYNDGTEKTLKADIKWITEVELTEDGIFTINFNNGESYTNTLTWIKGISIDEDGSISIVDNQDNVTKYENYIKLIENISINTGEEEGTGNQKVHVIYNTGEEEDIGNPLNYIIKMARVESDYHLIVWYSDPAKRQELINNGESYTYEDEDGWFDLGSVKDDSGILIGLNLEYELPDEITEEFLEEIISLLNELYSEGLQGVDLQGKVITVGNQSIENKLFFAFDYDKNVWYYLGSIGASSIEMDNIVLFDTDPKEKEDNLQEGGIWFLLEDFSDYE